MKNKYLVILFFLSIILISCICLIACNSNEDVKSYTVEYVSNGNGYIDGDSLQVVKSGQSTKSVAAVPDIGYEFLGWSDGLTEKSRIDNNISADRVIYASFRIIEFYIKYNAGVGGRINSYSSQRVQFGSDAHEVTAVADKGYEFVGWSDGITEPTRHDTDIRSVLNVTAYFTERMFSLNYSAGDGGTIQGEKEQLIKYPNSGLPVVATPKMGYKFVKWSDTGSTDPVRIEIKVEADVNAVAVFETVRDDGFGTEDNPVLINNYEQFLDMRSYPDLHYKLNCDLDLSEFDYRPLFNDSMGFNGLFDGDLHSIKNLAIHSASLNPSLFGIVNNGCIKNLTIENFEISICGPVESEGLLLIGSVAGDNNGSIDNVTVCGEINIDNVDKNGTAIGGLVGRSGGTVSQCRSNVLINISQKDNEKIQMYSYNVGGLIGVIYSGLINDCASNGEINSLDINKNVLLGGLVGYLIANQDSIDVKKCETNISISHVGNSCAQSGGMIAIAHVIDSAFIITECTANAVITGGFDAGGFIDYITAYGAYDIDIAFNCAECSINTMKSGGFIFWASGGNKLDDNFIIRYCNTKGYTNANMGAGFCWLAAQIRVYRCSSSMELQTKAASASFIQQMNEGVIEECFASGTITSEFHASGFALTIIGVYMNNCYSDCDIVITNTDSNADMRTFACGLVVFARDSQIDNCFSVGNIRGNVYTESKVSGQGSIVGEFIGSVNNTIINNCAVLHHDGTFATDYIVTIMSSSNVDLTIYDNIDDMDELLPMLNQGATNSIWIMGQHGYPQLNF